MESDIFCLNDYDCIGFDLDCTLAEYNVNELVKLVYDLLANFLVEKKNYDPKFLLKPFEENAYFLQKGLFMDFKKGNVLKINENGEIVKATHGTATLSDQEIIKQYGRNITSSVIKEFIKDPSLLMNKKCETLFRATLDIFDMCCTLIFARIVDSLDSKNGNKPLKEYKIWPDILAGVYQIYDYSVFSSGGSKFFSELKNNPSVYYKKWSQAKLAWLKELKSKKFVFLLTGSFIDFAEVTASYCIGENWKDYFHIVLCYARKPSFFSQGHPFYKVVNSEETDMVQGDLEMNSIYSQGSWDKLKNFILKQVNEPDLKCLYIGDNIFLDVYAPIRYNCCHSVMVSLELKEEFRSSQLWGSYFGEVSEKGVSYWSSLIKKNAMICVSSLDVFVNKPLNFQYNCLKSGKSNNLEKANGYYVN